MSFIFSDSTGNSRITPSSLQLALQGVGTIALVNQSQWLDNGSSFTIASVGWHGLEVKPLSVVTHVANEPMTISVDTRVYSVSITVVDAFGIPVGGASAQVTFANGTSVQEQSRSDGTVTFALIPLGSFHADITSFGLTSSFDGDASVQTQYQAKVTLSTPVLIVIVIVGVAVVSAMVYLLRSRRSSGREAPKEEPAAESQPDIPPLS